MRQNCTDLLGFCWLACLLLFGCVTETRQEQWQIRLDIDDQAVKAIVLGSAAVGGEDPPRDPLGRPRAPASLAIRADRGQVLHVIDPTASILDQLDRLERLDPIQPLPPSPEDSPTGSTLTTILLTHENSETLEGLRRLLQRLEPGRQVPVYAPRQILREIANDPSMRLLGLLERIELREARDGEELRLGRTVRLTPIESPIDSERSFLGYRIEGSRRALLYLPACGSLETVRRALVERRHGPVQVALLDGTRFDQREPPPPGWPRGCPPPMTSVLAILPEGFSSRLLLRFTRLPPRNPALDPDGRYLKLLIDRGAGLVEDGAEYWL